jgi:hypothetical protein
MRKIIGPFMAKKINFNVLNADDKYTLQNNEITCNIAPTQHMRCLLGFAFSTKHTI